jgi:energy-coupling factor transporter ATP-binding protein EcfA2
MRITKVKLSNYGSFYNTPEIEFDKKFSIVVGENNSGKTNLIKALSLVAGEAHRSNITRPDKDMIDPPDEPPYLEIEFNFEPDEMLKILRANDYRFYYPLNRTDCWNPANVPELFGKEANIRFLYRDNDVYSTFIPRFNEKISLTTERGIDSLKCEFTNKLNFVVEETITSTQLDRICWKIIHNHIPNNIYRFDSERKISKKSFSNEDFALKSDASNLAQVIISLKGKEEDQFKEYLRLVKKVFPSVQEILTTITGGEAEISIGFVEPNQRRSDLAVSLSQCGTGLGQVMAMLYVVVTADEPRIIIIDEPQSYLHPGAVRKLFEIFQLPKFQKHQYIVTTHSPTAIMSIREKTIVLVEQENMQSTTRTIDASNNKDIEQTLNAVGAKLSDVFGMDNILWVEGKTEELCFPMILAKNNIPLYGTNILGLADSTDLAGKHGKRILKIYARLSQGEGFLPPALAFISDADAKEKLADIYNQYGHLIHFLSRQNYESYLIESPKVLAEFLNEVDTEKTQPHTTEHVTQWVEDNQINDKYYADGVSFGKETWLEKINGAKFIKAMFYALTEKRRPYNKIRFNPELTRRLIEDNAEHFNEIVEMTRSILKQE